MKDDSTGHVGTLIRLAVFLKTESRRIGVDIEPHTHAITDKLRQHKQRNERHENQ